MGKPLHEPAREYTQRFHPATGGILLADVSAQVEAGQFIEPGLRPPLHPFRVIDPGPVRDQARVRRIPDESHRLARNGKPAVDLRADPQPLDEGTQRLVQEEVPLVPAVVAYLLPQQAGADEDLDPFRQTASPETDPAGTASRTSPPTSSGSRRRTPPRRGSTTSPRAWRGNRGSPSLRPSPRIRASTRRTPWDARSTFPTGRRSPPPRPPRGAI